VCGYESIRQAPCRQTHHVLKTDVVDGQCNHFYVTPAMLQVLSTVHRLQERWRQVYSGYLSYSQLAHCNAVRGTLLSIISMTSYFKFVSR
jgi:hypothetical protein